ncbi:hypothetical protein BJY59DRAFT_695850 [Rhodotorula toruloides]
MDGGSRTPVLEQQGLRHQPSGELEVLKDATSPVKSLFGPDARRAALGVSPLQRRGSNRRSVSTLSFSTSMTVSQAAAAEAPSTTAPASPTTSTMRPPFQPRSVSNPSTPTIPPLSALSASAASSATATPVPSPLFATSARDRSSASSGSGTASSSSVPHTPKDNSPNVSDLNFSTAAPAHVSKPSVKFDLGSTADEARWNKGRRMSTQSALGGGSFLHPPSSLGAPFAHRSNPSLPTFAGFGKPTVASVRDASTHGRTASALAPTPASRQPASNASTSGIGSSSSSTAVEETVYDRMKARHKAEAIEALKIGRDLNHLSGLVPDRERNDDDEDENEPLANLPTKGSALGGQSTMSGMSGMFMHPMAMGMGGTYSPLAVAPPGVDPYLCACSTSLSFPARADSRFVSHRRLAPARPEDVASPARLADDGDDARGRRPRQGGERRRQRDGRQRVERLWRRRRLDARRTDAQHEFRLVRRHGRDVRPASAATPLPAATPPHAFAEHAPPAFRSVLRHVATFLPASSTPRLLRHASLRRIRHGPSLGTRLDDGHARHSTSFRRWQGELGRRYRSTTSIECASLQQTCLGSHLTLTRRLDRHF